MTDEMRALVAETAKAVAAELARQSGVQHLECLPLEALAQAHDIPMTTLHYARQAGKGPRVFSIGRRVYCLRRDWNDWLEGLAATGGVKHLNAPRRGSVDQE
jgi:hypothetical protein